LTQYLLDTGICIYISKRKPAAVLSRLEQLRPGDVAMSVITYLELVCGAWKSQHAEANLASIGELCTIIPVRPLDASVAKQYGRIRSELEKRGSPIGACDLLIAAQALSLGLVLVTSNVREFARIEGLRIENWAERV